MIAHEAIYLEWVITHSIFIQWITRRKHDVKQKLHWKPHHPHPPPLASATIWKLENSDIETGRQNLRQLNCCFTTISSHFFTIYIYVFHKTEIDTVILRCWMGLHLTWFKIYDKKGSFFRVWIFAILQKKSRKRCDQFFSIHNRQQW